MNLIKMLQVIVVLVVAAPCRAAFALEDGTPANPENSQATAPVAKSDASRDSGASDEKHEGSRRTDHFRIGALAGVGFPRPLAIEGLVKIERVVGLGVEYSVLPKLSVSGIETSFWALSADARFFPFRDAFFIGLRAGHQHLGANGDVTIAGYGSVNEAVSIDTTFINPRIGFLWTWEPGVTLGLDLGVQIPLSVSASSALPAGTAALPQAAEVNGELSRVTNSIGRYTLPTVDLLRIGVLL